MNHKIVTPSVPKLVLILLEQLFLSALISLEEMRGDQIVFSKQDAIRKTLQDLKRFVLTNPISKFTVCMNGKDKVDPILTLTFKNFSDDEGIIQNEYYILINETYSTLEIYKGDNRDVAIKVR